MQTVILVIHLMICVALIATVLLQRSEGGALGIGGGGGGGGGLVTGRGAANLLTRTTSILAAVFFATSIMLTILARDASKPTSILDRLGDTPATTGEPVGESGTRSEKPATGGGVLDQFKRPAAPAPSGPTVPKSE